MRRMPILIALPAILLTVASGGCSGDDNKDGGSKTAAPRPAEQAAPGDLLGTYAMTLKPSDLPPNRAPGANGPGREMDARDRQQRWPEWRPGFQDRQRPARDARELAFRSGRRPHPPT
jgi:hypothetical protein